MRRHTFVPIALTAGLFGLAACGGAGGDGDSSGANAEPGAKAQQDAASTTDSGARTPVNGGTTRLRLDNTVEDALSKVGIRVGAVAPAEKTAGGVDLPIRTGALDTDPLAGRVEHDGGIRFTVAGRSVEATDLVLQPAKDLVTARIAGKRVPLLGVDFSRARETPSSGRIVLPATATTIASDAVSSLNDRIGVKLIPRSLSLGRLTVSADVGD